ncbi:hypothetical protein AAC387_Pa06g1290 [Persea americana]
MSEAGSPFVMFFGQVCLIFLWYLQVYPRFSFATKNALDLFAKNPRWVSSSFLLLVSMPLSRAIRLGDKRLGHRLLTLFQTI